MVASTLASVLSWAEEHWGRELETLTMFSRYSQREGGRSMGVYSNKKSVYQVQDGALGQIFQETP